MIFPETPKGSPEAIEGAADLLSQGAGFLEEGESALTQTASGLSGVTWSSPAEGRFTASAGALSGVCDGAQAALRTCGNAARQYAEALATAKRVIERAREEFEEAQVAEATTGRLIGSLSIRRGMAEDEDQSGFDGAIADAQDELGAAVDRSQAALQRAQRAREDFDEAQRTAIGALEGTAPGATSVFGAPAVGAATGGVAFPSAGTGGLGAVGGGFGVPPGGLAAFTGVVPFDRLQEIDGYAKNRHLDLHGQTEVDDLTIAITSAASFGAAGPISALLTRGAGGAVTRSGGTTVAGGSRAGAGRAGGSRAGGKQADEATRLAARSDARQLNTEKLGELAGMGGVPLGGEAGKVAGLLVREEIRLGLRTQARVARLGIEQAVKPRIAALLSARALSQGVRRGLSDDAVARLRELSNVP